MKWARQSYYKFSSCGNDYPQSHYPRDIPLYTSINQKLWWWWSKFPLNRLSSHNFLWWSNNYLCTSILLLSFWDFKTHTHFHLFIDLFILSVLLYLLSLFIASHFPLCSTCSLVHILQTFLENLLGANL